MKIKILGSAAAEGVPALFCKCPMCQYARDNLGKEVRKRSSVMIDKSIVIDLGPDALWNSVSAGICYDTVSYILFSHSHFDHLSISSLLLASNKYRCYGLNYKRKIVGSKETYQYLVSQAEVMKCDDFWELYEYIIVAPYDILKLGDYSVTVLPSNHTNDEQSLFFIVSDSTATLFYGTDAKPYSIEEVFGRILPIKFDIIISDCTYGLRAAYKGRHMGLPDNLSIQQEMLKKGMLYQYSVYILTHFSHDSLMPYAKIDKAAQKHNMVIAYDEMEIDTQQLKSIKI